MLFRSERVEVVARRLDLAAVDDLVAESEEDVLDVAPGLRRGVQRAAPAGPHAAEHLGGERHVGAFRGELVVELGVADRGAAGIERLLDLLADRVQADPGLAVADLAELQLQRARATEPLDRGLLDVVRGLRALERGGRVADVRVGIPSHGGDCIRAFGDYTTVSAYDSIARLYDPWSAGVVEDISFYVDEALGGGGTVVELGVGTGRIAIPTAMAGVNVIGVDSSEGMLAVCGERGHEAGVEALLDLRLGDLRRPPVDERVPLVTCPFRAYLHLASDDERLQALGAARELLEPGGRLVFDVFAPSQDDIEETHGRWIEREPWIDERADWDLDARTLTLSVRGAQGASSMILWWLEPERWNALLLEAGFSIDACFGWFDRRPYAGGEDTVWVATRR